MKYIMLLLIFIFLLSVLLLRDQTKKHEHNNCHYLSDRCDIIMKNSQNFDLINICLDNFERICDNR